MRSGFSLVELSIVLVILGLLTGGILAGQSLIRAAEIRAVSTEYGRYTTAVATFRDKYFALPGDFNKATDFWGTSANCPGTYLQGTTDGTTCNGDANGRVYTDLPAAPTINEIFRFWQHLGNAGLIEGQYNGVTAATNNYFLGVGTTNTPASKLGNARWSIMSADNTLGTNIIAAFRYDLAPFHFQIGAMATNSWNSNSVLKPEEAWNIDTKMDDGSPGMGKVLSNWNNSCTNAADSSVKTANYTLTNNAVSCILFMRGS